MASASSSRYRPPSFNPASSTSRKPVSTSRVLAALDAPTPSSHRGLTPDSDGVIDLTTPEKPARPSVTPFPVDGPRIAKGRTSSLKENEGGKKVAPKSSARALKSASAPAPGASVYSKKPSSAAKPEVKLPTYTYAEYIPKPTVVYVKTEEEANEMVEGLNGAVGFDLEWPIGGKAALVQLCDSSLILLIQVSFMKKFPQKVKEIIEDPAVPKMGVNIRNDGMKLYRDYGILAANLVELGALAGAADTRFAAVYNRRIVSLAKVVAFYLRRALDKGPVRTSDWSAALSKEQMTYAANDAHCALMVYRKVLGIARAAHVALDAALYTADLSKELKSPSAAVPDTHAAEGRAPPVAATPWTPGVGGARRP